MCVYYNIIYVSIYFYVLIIMCVCMCNCVDMFLLVYCVIYMHEHILYNVYVCWYVLPDI